jgi:hypothetical protein
VSRARCGILHAASQTRDPGFFFWSNVTGTPDLQRTVPQVLHAALRPGNEKRRSRKCECIPIPVLTTSLILLVSCPVRGASRGDPEVGQSESLAGAG